jgi:hypothetical protein
MSRARLGLVALFALWSLLLFGGSGVIEWIGDGLVQMLAHIHLGWLGTILAGLGKALIFIIWLISACAFAIFFSLTGQLRRAMQAQAAKPSGQTTDATVTLKRAPDGSYR